MNKVFGYYIFGGLLIGTLFGRMWAASSNSIVGIGIGALAGAFLGWFIAAAVLEQNKKTKKTEENHRG
ncbi:MAG TPA: hypothetical protein VFY26_19215 [Anaerolineales bacterium]|nr:hypothetical protein [Anaerolineales bacterium]